MKDDLIQRYIYAVTKRLPGKTREDVSLELSGLIDDMLSERCNGETPTDKDVRVVLTELGSPRELSEKYDTSAKKCLIGHPYYSTYLFVLKIVLICASAGLTMSSCILQIMEPQAWYAAIFQWMGMLWQGLTQAFAFVTLLFAFFYHKDVKLDEPFNFDDLPSVPKKNEEISRWDPILGIAISVIFLVLFLAAPEWIAVFYRAETWIPMFNGEVVRSCWYLILGFTLAGLLREVVKLMEKRYNRRVLIVTVGCNVVSAGLAVWWLTTRDLFNPRFQETMMALFSGENQAIANLFANFQYFFLAVMIFALLLDTIETVVKTLRK